MRARQRQLSCVRVNRPDSSRLQYVGVQKRVSQFTMHPGVSYSGDASDRVASDLRACLISTTASPPPLSPRSQVPGDGLEGPDQDPRGGREDQG